MVAESESEALRFEDRVLYQVVDLTGAARAGWEGAASEYDLAARLSGELGITEEFARGRDYLASPQRPRMQEALKWLGRAGFVERKQRPGAADRVRPTPPGRAQVAAWRAAQPSPSAADGAPRGISDEALNQAIMETWAKKLALLRALYRATADDRAGATEMQPFGGPLGFSEKLTSELADALDAEGLLACVASAGYRRQVILTEAGRQMVEQSLPHPPRAEETADTAASAVTPAGVGSGSPVGQERPGASQHAAVDPSIEQIRGLIFLLERDLDSLGLGEQESDDLHADLDTMNRELARPRPRARVLRETLHGMLPPLRDTAAGATANAYAHRLALLLVGFPPP